MGAENTNGKPYWKVKFRMALSLQRNYQVAMPLFKRAYIIWLTSLYSTGEVSLLFVVFTFDFDFGFSLSCWLALTSSALMFSSWSVSVNGLGFVFSSSNSPSCFRDNSRLALAKGLSPTFFLLWVSFMGLVDFFADSTSPFFFSLSFRLARAMPKGLLAFFFSLWSVSGGGLFSFSLSKSLPFCFFLALGLDVVACCDVVMVGWKIQRNRKFKDRMHQQWMRLRKLHCKLTHINCHTILILLSHHMTVKKILIQTLACQLSSTLT